MKKLTPTELAICGPVLFLIGSSFALPALLFFGQMFYSCLLDPIPGISRSEALKHEMGNPDVLAIAELMLTLLVAGLVMLGLAAAAFLAYRKRSRRAVEKWKQRRLDSLQPPQDSQKATSAAASDTDARIRQPLSQATVIVLRPVDDNTHGNG